MAHIEWRARYRDEAGRERSRRFATRRDAERFSRTTDAVVGCRVRYRDPDGRERSQSFGRAVDPEAFLHSVETDKRRGAWVDPDLGKVSLAEWAARFMRASAHLKPKTREGYESLWRTHVAPAFGARPIASVEPMEVREWVASLAALSASRTRQAYRLLSAMFSVAVESGLIVRSPCSGVKLPKLPRRDMLIIAPDEVERLADASGRYALLIHTLAYGGLRWGEAVALRRGGCHVLRSRLEVAESCTEVSGALVWGEPKTYQRRAVAIPPFLRDLIAAHLAMSVPDDPTALVFTAPEGGALRRGNFYRRVYRPAAARAGLPPELRIHDLRHTSASLLIREGANVKQVQRHLGHASATVTLDRSSHLWPDDLDRVADLLEAARLRSRAARMRPDGGPIVVGLGSVRAEKRA